MKKSIKLLIIITFFIIILSIEKNVEANSIKKLSMDIFIDNEGTAQVTETWNCSASEGTEVYHPYYNLGNSKITNLTVCENGQKYTTLSSWNTSGSLATKAYKCGINKVSDGVEICWGISKYGSHTYTVKYNITNFVSELSDAQIVYWTLIPYKFSNTIGSVYIKIYSDFKYSDTLDVWGYGDYGAPAYVYNGYIEMQSNESVKSNEYMTILVKFPKGTFNTQNKLEHNFDYYYTMAQKDTKRYSKNNMSKMVGFIFSMLISIIFTIFPVILAILPSRLNNKSSKEIIIDRKSLKRVKTATYYRDIPCEKDLFKAYFIAYEYGVNKNKTDILGAVILKWIKEGIVKLEKRESNGIIKKEEEVLVLGEINEEIMPVDIERRLYKMIMIASKDGILEKNELKDWCKKNYSEILRWFDSALREQKNKLATLGYIESKEEKRFFGLSKYSFKVETELLIKEAEKISGLKKFLLNYSLISEREAIEVKLFEEYMIYAQMLGIADKVAKQFKNLYPNIIEQSSYNNFDNIIFINNCASRGVRSAESAKSAAEARARAESYSSGGGGYSSGGGGGGSFGGGGRRRWRFPLKLDKYFIIIFVDTNLISV